MGALALAAGCGSGSSGPTGGNAASATTGAGQSAPATQQAPGQGGQGSQGGQNTQPGGPPASVGSTPNAPSAQGAGPCQTSQLSASVGPRSGAAGTVGFPIVFTNTGAQSCVLEGFPGVSYAAGPGGEPIGAPATRDGGAAGPVRLEPGDQASALVLATDVHNYPTEQCNPVAASGLRVYPPDNTDSLYVEYTGTACSLPEPETAQLRVHAVVAGGNGR